MKIDNETAKVVRESAEALRITKTEEWKELRRTFFDKVFELERSNDLPDDFSDERLGSLIRSRKQAAKVLREFILSVEGTASTHESNDELLDLLKNDSFDYE